MEKKGDVLGRLVLWATMEDMMNKTAIKSKTILTNSIVAAIYTILKWKNVDVPEDVLISFLTLGNILLRLVTNKPIISN